MEHNYMLVERYGYRETLVGFYATKQEAEAERKTRLEVYREIRLDHGSLVIRRNSW